MKQSTLHLIVTIANSLLLIFILFKILAKKPSRPAFFNGEGEDDPLYEQGVEIAKKYGKISTSLIQRKLRISYSRAARMVDALEESTIVDEDKQYIGNLE